MVDSKPKKRQNSQKESRELKSRRDGREITLQALYQLDWGLSSLDDILKFDWLEKPIKKETRDFIHELIHGTTNHIKDIDLLIIRHSSHWTFDRIPKVELAIMRLSIYSLLFLKDIPPIVIIDEAIELSKKYSGEDAWRYINGMLDAIYHKEILSNEVIRELDKE